MRNRWAGPWALRRWTFLVVATFIVWPAQSAAPRSSCDDSFDARAWELVAVACSGARWGGRERLSRAWMAWSQHREGEALTIAEQLVDTNVGPDAAYLAGYIRGRRNRSSEQVLSRVLFEQALRGYQRMERHADASRAADLLSRLAQSESRFSDELQMAQLAVAEGELSRSSSVLARASAALAEANDWIGMEQAARENFLRAEQLSESSPAELAYIYLKHAAFLLDLGAPHDLETSLGYLDAAAAMRDRAHAVGLGTQVSRLALAIRLDRADALSQLGRIDAADGEIAAAKRELGSDADTDRRARIRLVEGYVAARRNDLVTAESLFTEADDGSLDGDYRWRIALELARSYRAAGRPERAERSYRAAIAIVEKLRGAAAVVELRPWMLARRTLPYVELLALLVEQQRAVDALVITESLHARAWLDVVLGSGTDLGGNSELALSAARIRQRLSAASAPPLDASSLMTTIGNLEALVYLTLGSVTWRAHVVHGDLTFDRLSADVLTLAQRFSAAPGDSSAAERASTALLPVGLSDGHDTLYVVATGPLANVPFAALRWRGKYLIDERPVARLPGLAALRVTASTWDQRAILVGDARGDLPSAAYEVRKLAAEMGVSASIGVAASSRVLASARGARILHVATHGVSTPSGRAIVLADRNLTAADVLDAGLNPQIVMLSGCATAVSNDAESWDGFPSAFLAAGSRYVVATLQSVDDTAAAQVIEAYYAKPAEMDPIVRLAAAQREVSGSLPVAAWASFAAWGSATCDDHTRQCSIQRRASSSQAGCDRPNCYQRSRP